MANEGKLSELDQYEASRFFSEREKVALRYTDAVTWNPEAADDELWHALHHHFTEPELVELGAFIGFIAGGQRWIHTLNVQHGEVLFETTTGLREDVAANLATPQAGD